MKAITLWQPWATLIAAGHKTVETRSWCTNYRGPIAIHASKRRPELGIFGDEGLLLHLLKSRFGIKLMEPLPLGAIVATANLTGCGRMTDEMIDQLSLSHPVEIEVGNWEAGRYAWLLEDIKPLDPPLPARGAQGLWDWEPPA